MTVVDRGNEARLLSLAVADDPDAWQRAGFAVVDGTVTIGATAVELTGRADDRARRGIGSWTVAGLDAEGSGTIDGIPTTFAPHAATVAGPATSVAPAEHPNGVTGIDHVVVLTPDLDRTIAAFAHVGLAVRRIRETESYGSPMRQAFLRIGGTIVEVVGGHDGSGQTVEEAPATFFGLALDVDDLDRTSALLGDGLGAIRSAVQEGRRISTIRHKGFGMSVATALMDDRSDARLAEATTAEAGT